MGRLTLRVIPSSVLGVQSDAEKRVFRLLKQVNFGPSDVALHSFNLGEHTYKRWGEIDFLILSRRGILVLEVKGGRVACRNGIWEFKDRYDKVSRKRESPAAQAKSAYFSLEEKYLSPRFRGDLDGLAKGWGVLFEGIERVVSEGSSKLPELPDNITGYKRDCAGHNALKGFLNRLFDYWEGHARGGAGQVSDALIARMVDYLRPSFEQLPPLNSQLKEFSEELCELTDEQCRRLDELIENDRMIIVGGAGTGKTFLALAAARYDAAEGRSVLLLTRSSFLSDFLNSHELPKEITVCCLDELSGLVSSHERWDTLVVDEGQDLCQLETLECLGNAIVGGLETGRWRWFGDPNNQVSSSFPFDEDVFDYLRQFALIRRLSENIRNAPPIVDSLLAVASVDLGNPRARGVGSEVRIQKVGTDEEVSKMVSSIVGKWLAGPNPVARREVVVLVPQEDRTSILVEALESAGIRAEPLSRRALSGRSRDCVLVSNFDNFKGLERPVVCVAGLGNPDDLTDFQRSAYMSFSRANHTLSVVCLPAQAELLTKLEIEQAKVGLEPRRT